MIKRLRIKLVMAAIGSLFAVLTIIIGSAGIMNYYSIVKDANRKCDLLCANDGVFPNMTQEYSTHFSPEMAFETRFFFVTFDERGTIQSVNTGKIAAVDEMEARSYAKKILEKGKTNGFIDSYRYLVSTDVYGKTSIYFVDCSRDLQSLYRFLSTSCLMAILGSLATLLLLIIVSERIVKPVSDSYEKQKQFITDAGHELKTPLTIINADAEVLEMDHGPNEWIEDIRIQTTRMANLTNDLVYLARMEEHPKVDRTHFSLSDVIKETVSNYQVVAKANEMNITSEIESGLMMNGDENEIQRCVAIFLDNAIKYTDEKGKIQVLFDKWHNQNRLRIYNTTTHIDDESIEHLFDRFYRMDQSRNSKTGGYGLGLSIASAIVERHNGKIYASTSDGKSLLITVTFPRT